MAYYGTSYANLPTTYAVGQSPYYNATPSWQTASRYQGEYPMPPIHAAQFAANPGPGSAPSPQFTPQAPPANQYSNPPPITNPFSSPHTNFNYGFPHDPLPNAYGGSYGGLGGWLNLWGGFH